MSEKPVNLKEMAYQILKENILDCRYNPGSELSEKDLAEQLNIGRTPIREALLQLHNENFVEIVPRKTIKVSEITEQTIHELYQVRRLIEPAILVQFQNGFDITRLLDYVDAFKRLGSAVVDAKEFYTLDIAFHNYFVECSDNTMLIDFYRKLMEVQYRIGMYSSKVATNNIHTQTAQEHEAIVNAIVTKQDEDLKQAFEHHLNQSYLAALQSIRIKND